MTKLIPLDHDPFATAAPPQLVPLEKDPFAQPRLVPLDRDPFEQPIGTSATETGDLGAQPPHSPAPSIPSEQPPTSPETQPSAPAGGTPEQTPPLTPSAASPGFFSQTKSGFVGGFMGGNPKMLGSAIEGFGILSDSPDLEKRGADIAQYGETELKKYAPAVPSFRNIPAESWGQTFENVASYSGYALGQGVSSTIPPIAGGLVGAGVGALTPVPGGALAGAIGGAALPAYVQNYGDVHSSAKEDPDIRKLMTDGALTKKEVAAVSALAAVPITALDLVGEAMFARSALQPAKQALVKRLATGYAKGSLVEGSTEGLQEVFAGWSRDYLGANPELQKRVDGIIDNFLGGMIPGGVFGAATKGVQRQPAPATADVIRATAAEMMTQVEVDGRPIDKIAARFPQTEDSLAQQKPEMRDEAILPQPVGPLWHSTLQQTIEKGPNSAPIEQWLGTVQNAPGVKQEELETRGFTQLMASVPRDANGKISKTDILTHLEENAINVEEVAQQETRDASGRVTTAPQHAAYTVPGPKEGYRNLLLTLPNREVVDPSKGLEQLAEAREGNYNSQHWPVPNVLAHVRFSERTDLTGNRILFLEEIQSDWHQEGRKSGYSTTTVDTKGWSANPAVQFTDPATGVVRRGSWTIRRADGTVQGHVPHSAASTAEKAIQIAAESQRIPDGPFKTSWPELTIKRMIRWAADNGYERISWNSPQLAKYVAGQPAGLDARTQRGMDEFYGKIVPSIARKWAKRLGGTYGTTRLNAGHSPYAVKEVPRGSGIWGVIDTRTGTPLEGGISQEEANAIASAANRRTLAERPEVEYITLPPEARTMVQQRGMPLFDEAVGPSGVEFRLEGNVKFDGLNRLSMIVRELQKRMGIKEKLEIIFYSNPRGRSNGQLTTPGISKPWYEIKINLAAHLDANGNVMPERVYVTLMHEFGHMVARTTLLDPKWASYVPAIWEAYNRWKGEQKFSQNIPEVLKNRYNVVKSEMVGEWWKGTTPGRFGDLPAHEIEYQLSFDEWFAEQVARWATTDAKPLSVVDKFFKEVAKKVVEVFRRFAQAAGLQYHPSEAVAEWLHSVLGNEPIYSPAAIARLKESQLKNQAQIDKEVPNVQAVPRQAASAGLEAAIRKLFPEGVPGQLAEGMAWVDRFNWFYKFMLSLPQVAARNMHITQLQRYTSLIREANLTKQRVREAALSVGKQWRSLGQIESDKLTQVLEKLMLMEYRTPQEVKDGIRRHPTVPELTRMISDAKLTDRGVKVLAKVQKLFEVYLQLVQDVAVSQAQNITDPVSRATAIDEIIAKFNDLRKAPYFPAFRFGQHTITVRNARGEVIYFATAERRGLKSAKRVQEEIGRDIEKQLKQGETIQLGYLDDHVMPFMGLPAPLLAMMEEKLNLTAKQKDALEQLRFAVAPTQSFKHRFQHKKMVEGYSEDFLRAFSTYFFHGANYLARVQFADPLRTEIASLRDEVRHSPGNITKRKKIGNYMAEHYREWSDPSTDFAAIRAIAFLWMLAWTPAAASLNLTQTLTTTTPFLSSKFGDKKAMGAITRAGADLSTYYKRGTLASMPEYEMKALSEAVRQGIITEALATELAALSEGNNLLGNFGNKGRQAWNWLQEKGAFLFEMAEQMNRRVAFRAALKLARENPTAPYIKDALTRHRAEYERLLREGWSEHDAVPYIVAADVVHTTQFEYSAAMQPRFMRGILRPVFIFKTFVQNYLFFLWNNPSAAWRSILVLAFLGGLMGLPGAEDANRIIKVIAWKIFGKDFDLETEARRFILDMFEGVVPPDLILGGMGRRGFGLPAIADLLGETVRGSFDYAKAGRRFLYGPNAVPGGAPIDSRSRAIGMGNILPLEVDKLFGPHKDNAQSIADAAQSVSGAAFGLGFNIYKFLEDRELGWDDPKRYERILPRGMANLTRASRVYMEGMERNRKGAAVIRVDARDPTQLAEIVGMSLGYNPLRLQAQWDRIMAEREALAYWDIRQGVLLKQADNAFRTGDEKDKESVRAAIRKFNDDLPDAAKEKRITTETIRRSMTARENSRQRQEAGLPMGNKNIGLIQDIQRLFPESVIDVRKR